LEEAVDHRDGLQRMPLPVGIDAVTFVNDLKPADVADAASWLSGRAAR
jgi:3-dehydroquinate synthase